MSSDEIREKYLRFFEKKGHKKIEPSPLVLENDPTTLFTSAGMQPLIPYLKGEAHPKGKRLVDSQPALRLQDIEEVGDNRHTTFFEMLGNWSLGDYFKKEQLEWCLEFFTQELGLPKEKLWVSVFEGSKEVAKDIESEKIWKSLGIPDERIYFYGVDKNWWSRSGEPGFMPPGEIGGPDSEVFFDFGTKHDPKYGKECHPNCQCGRFMEIGNSVFIEYEKNEDGTLTELPQKNVDFGGGLERISAVVNGVPDIFRIDRYQKAIKELETQTKVKYGSSKDSDIAFRTIADHFRAAMALISEGVVPANKLQGYVLRRLLRRAGARMRKFSGVGVTQLSKKVASTFPNGQKAEDIIGEEMEKFTQILDTGAQLIKKNPDIKPFDLYQSYGLPYEITSEIFLESGKALDNEDKEEFEAKLKKHQEDSRTASAGMFKGGLADSSKEVTKLHTATHLLHSSLRKVLGEGVSQKGSNITAERLRFDFSFPDKLTETQLKEVEGAMNEQIKKDLPVGFEEKSLTEAQEEGALAFFGEKYGAKIKVYTIGDPRGDWFSKEVCGGPHVTHLGEVGNVKIIKQEKVGSGVVRIYAGVE